MSDLILHHYPMSPFSEKVRLMLGLKGLAWKSVLVPSIMPKPDVLALTGGYRKTPFLQIGSHIYCDTALIAEVLEQLAPSPSLFPDSSSGLAETFAQWADEKLFWAAMGYNFQPKGVAQIFGGGPPEQWAEQAKAFAEDRSKMRSGMPRMAPGDAASAYRSYLERLEVMLQSKPFLFGADACIADFSAYHPLWFTRTQTSVMAGILDSRPKVLAWMNRMASFGHGRMSESSAAEAIAICAASPDQSDVLPGEAFMDDHRISLGSSVSVCSESFGTESTVGELVAAGPSRYTILRNDPRAGRVHVHFPRIGFQLKAAP